MIDIPVWLMRLWVVFSAFWAIMVAIGVYLVWPVDPPPGFHSGMFDDLIPSLMEQRETVLFYAAGIAIAGDGLLLLIALAAVWVGDGFRRRA